MSTSVVKMACWAMLGTVALASCGGGDSTVKPGPDGGQQAGTEITIKRDKYGTPHVFANSTYDLFYGFGYAVAQDRLYQLEMAKR